MRDFIVNHAGRFALLWLGCVVAGTGLGAWAIALGTPFLVVVLTQLALQLTLALTIATCVPDRFGGFVAVALSTTVPFGTFVGWAEVTLSKTTTAATFVIAIGAALAGAAVWPWLTPRERLPRSAQARI